MTVLLLTDKEIGTIGGRSWISIATAAEGPPAQRLGGMAAALALAFQAIVGDWLGLARVLGQGKDACLAHTPSAAGTISDLGLMLAWTALVDDLAASRQDVAVLCGDPWLFRHLAGRAGVVVAAPAPALWRREARLRVRGTLSRLRVGLRMAGQAWQLRHQRRLCGRGQGALLVYGHPASRADGFDAYFGTLPQVQPELTRVLHVDCPVDRALSLEADGRTVSLHAFGSVLFALTRLWMARWRPAAIASPHPWLIRRAAALEGGSGQAAMIRWQIHCQERWLNAARPSCVAWPWENHGWERVFVTQCRRRAIATLGCQHATIGDLERNHAVFSMPDPAAQLPDRISAAGPAWAERLVHWGIPTERLNIGGVWRLGASLPLDHAPAGPVFLALPAHEGIAVQMIAAARRIAQAGIEVLVREHPMTPVKFRPEPGLRASPGPLAEIGPVRTVIYAATTVGLEALLAGLPVIRFLPEGLIANDILPAPLCVTAAAAEDLLEALPGDPAVIPPDAATIFVAADPMVWKSWLGGHR